MSLPFLASRTPTFCPGCPHRDSAAVLSQIKKDFLLGSYMREKHNALPTDLVFHGDIGCYVMLKYEPYTDLIHNLSGMGLGAGTGAGISSFIKNKEVLFMGDSTFFHSGMSSLSDAVKNKKDLTLVILDNGSTAMTGHQPVPSTDTNIMGEKTNAQKIEEIVRGMGRGIRLVRRVNPEHRAKYRKLLEKTVLLDGVKVIVSEKECAITYHRKLRGSREKLFETKPWLKEKKVEIDEEVCEFCMECTKATGCPGLEFRETDEGLKMGTRASLCVSDGACYRVEACPSFFEVSVKKNLKANRTPLYKKHSSDPLSGFPEVSRAVGDFNMYIPGVGGMGTGVIVSLVSLAAREEGLEISFTEKKGLAVRNGGVYSHIRISRSPISNYIIPDASADFILGLDPLETLRIFEDSFPFHVFGVGRTKVLLNRSLTLTIPQLTGKESYAHWGKEAVKVFDRYSGPNEFYHQDFSKEALLYMGDALFVNMIMIGFAYQKGIFPISLSSFVKAMRLLWKGKKYDLNFEAFQVGRKLATEDGVKTQGRENSAWEECVNELDEEIRLSLGPRKKRTEEFAKLKIWIEEEKLWTEHKTYLLKKAFLIFQGFSFRDARIFLDRARELLKKNKICDSPLNETELLIALYRGSVVKDEFFVAYLLTRPAKQKELAKKYQLHFENGDKIKIRHINRPRIQIGKWTFEWTRRSSPFFLRLFKQLRPVRMLINKIFFPYHRQAWHFRRVYGSLLGALTDIASWGEREKELLLSPLKIRGFREVRAEKEEEFIEEILRYLAGQEKKQNKKEQHQLEKSRSL